MKKLIKNDYIHYFLLFFIVPIVNYINFFMLDYLTAWSYEVIPVMIYSIIIILSEIIIMFFLNVLVIYFYKSSDDLNIKKTIPLLNKLFIIGNFFFFASTFKYSLWFFVPLSQFFTILIFASWVLIDNKHVKLPVSKQLLTVKKINDPILTKKIKFISIVAFSYFILNVIALYIIKINYNPARRSLEYFFKGTGIKVHF